MALVSPNQETCSSHFSERSQKPRSISLEFRGNRSGLAVHIAPIDIARWECSGWQDKRCTGWRHIAVSSTTSVLAQFVRWPTPLAQCFAPKKHRVLCRTNPLQTEGWSISDHPFAFHPEKQGPHHVQRTGPTSGKTQLDSHSKFGWRRAHPSHYHPASHWQGRRQGTLAALRRRRNRRGVGHRTAQRDCRLHRAAYDAGELPRPGQGQHGSHTQRGEGRGSQEGCRRQEDRQGRHENADCARKGSGSEGPG